jgi:hypothetical protein
MEEPTTKTSEPKRPTKKDPVKKNVVLKRSTWIPQSCCRAMGIIIGFHHFLRFTHLAALEKEKPRSLGGEPGFCEPGGKFV